MDPRQEAFSGAEAIQFHGAGEAAAGAKTGGSALWSLATLTAILLLMIAWAQYLPCWGSTETSGRRRIPWPERGARKNPGAPGFAGREA